MDPAVFATLDHSTSTGPIIAVSIACILLSMMAVTLRVYTRQFLLNRVGPDDFMAVAALAGVTALGAITIIHTRFGLGTHIYDIIATDPLSIMDFFKFFYLGVVVYNVSLLFVKLSLFLQYYRLVDQVPRYRTLFLVAGFVVVGWTISMIGTMTFICIPVYAYWDKSVPNVCLSDPVMQLTNSIGNILTDIMLLLLPMPVLWNLKLPPRQKWSVIGIFSLGAFTCVISFLRVVFVFGHGPSSDITFEGTTITGWTIAEVTVGLMASSLITLRPLMSKLSPAAWRSRSGKSTGGGTSTNKTTNKDPKSAAGAFSTTDKNGIPLEDGGGNNNNEPPIQLQPVPQHSRNQRVPSREEHHPQLDINYSLDRQQQQWRQQRRQQEQLQEQQRQQRRQQAQAELDSRPYSPPESDGDLSRSSSDVELVVQKNVPTPTPSQTNRRKSRANTLTAAPDGWGPPPPPPAFYFSEQQQESATQQRRSQRQQEYQRHRQSRSASFFQNNNNNNYNDSRVIGAEQQDVIGLATSSPAVRDNPQHRRHASSRSADRIISLHPSSVSTAPPTPLPPPPPPPKSPWALAAALPPPPPHMGGPLPPLPAGPGSGLPRAPRPSAPQHAKSQSSSSTRSDVSYEVKVWSQKGAAGGPYEGGPMR
ncbi:Integral membrane protein [Apiospora kogelbergensis]|uniref:Integral membrane protein n=1 Tax=Apiospora kogelbergensis TaxID=1337665 RepID=UPI0031305412